MPTYNITYQVDGVDKGPEEVEVPVEYTENANDVRKYITSTLVARYINQADYLFSLLFSLKE